ncbi:MAG: hypothetical protein ACYDDC_06120 [Thermoplasmataceae archaeon]
MSLWIAEIIVHGKEYLLTNFDAPDRESAKKYLIDRYGNTMGIINLVESSASPKKATQSTLGEVDE